MRHSPQSCNVSGLLAIYQAVTVASGQCKRVEEQLFMQWQIMEWTLQEEGWLMRP